MRIITAANCRYKISSLRGSLTGFQQSREDRILFEMTNPFSDGHKNLIRIFIHTKPVEAANKKTRKSYRGQINTISFELGNKTHRRNGSSCERHRSGPIFSAIVFKRLAAASCDMPVDGARAKISQKTIQEEIVAR